MESTILMPELKERLTKYANDLRKIKDLEAQVKDLKSDIKDEMSFLSNELVSTGLESISIPEVGSFKGIEEYKLFFPSKSKLAERKKFLNQIGKHFGQNAVLDMLSVSYSTVKRLNDDAIEQNIIPEDGLLDGLDNPTRSISMRFTRKR